jgi:hypothetical protein
VEVSGNIVAHQRSGTGNVYGIYIQNELNTTYGGGLQVVVGSKIRDNIVYDWEDSDNGGGLSFYIGQTAAGVEVTGNTFYQPNRSIIFLHHWINI